MAKPPIRGTQTLVDQMTWVWARPLLTLIEVGWRWIFGIPLLLIVARELKGIFHLLPPVQFGLTRLDSNNPWQITASIAEAWRGYTPYVVPVLHWLLPLIFVGWVALSGLGRSLLLKRMEPTKAWRPFSLLALQAVQAVVFAAVIALWWHGMGAIAAANIYIEGEANLVGYLMQVILLTLGMYVAWALVSWPVLVAPVLVVMEGLTPWAALGQSFRLGKGFTSKLVEINLVMGIVRLALIVLAAVLSAAPLPFSDQIGPEVLRKISLIALVFNFVSNDAFQVVRIKSFIEFWRRFRAGDAKKV